MRVVAADDAVRLVHDGDTVLIGGSGGGHAVPEALIVALERRFLNEGHPKGITSLHPVGIGDEAAQGVSRFAHSGMLKRIVCGSFIDSPAIEGLASRDEIEAYTLPQGALSQLMREMAAGRPGLVTHVGLHTFVDPRHEGGRQSPSAQEDLVELVTVAGREWLFYKPFAVDVTFLRGTTADEDGNVTMEQEAVFGEMLSMAQATRRAGGVVIVQVRRLAKRGALPAKQVKIPGMLVDLVVVDPDQRQTYPTAYSPAYAGELRVPESEIEPMPFDARKVVARRAAMELERGAVCNLGSGISTGLARVAAEEEILDQVVLTNEQGLIGGAPAGGVEAGAATNFTAMIDQPYQFDFYDGGGLDIAFLSFAQVDRDGNVNVSRFGNRVIGVGGFMNISQNAKRVVFSGTFTAGGLAIAWPDGQAAIASEGKHRKFLDRLDQLTYNAKLGQERGQSVTFVTERAVFRARQEGLELAEIAPGIDIERDILAQMDFRPRLAEDLCEMDARLFQPAPMGLAADIAARPARTGPVRLRDWERER
ncbi:MAG: coenzyme transferase family protein [Thermomicrobiales bacterium]|nr:coenzyme transferase family protein [Thermomicrobiales bacterium]